MVAEKAVARHHMEQAASISGLHIASFWPHVKPADSFDANSSIGEPADLVHEPAGGCQANRCLILVIKASRTPR